MWVWLKALGIFLVPFNHPCLLKSGVSPLGKNPCLWGGTYLYGLYMGVTPPPPGGKAPIPTKYLTEMLQLILTENAFQFCSSNYLHTQRTAMGTKIAVGFANTLQTHRNFSVHETLLVSPIRCEERLHYRRSAPASKDLFLSNHL